MQIRDIIIKIKSPDEKHALGIWTTSFDAGRVGDTGVTRLTFNRPDQYVSSNLRLVFQTGYKDPIMVDLGQSNTFMLTSAQTQSTEFKLQVIFTEANTGVEVKSNKLTFYLTSSIPTNKTCNIDWMQELLQFALSEKVSMTRIVPEYPVIDPQEDSDQEPIPTYYLKGFNHFGDLIFNIEIPFKDAYDQLNQDSGEVTFADLVANKISYNNKLINPGESENLPPQLQATQVQAAIDELITNLFNLKNSIPGDVTQIAAQLAEITTSINNLNDQVNTTNAVDQVQTQNLTRVQEDLSKTNTTVTNLTTSVNTLSSTVGQHSTDLVNIQDTLTEQGVALNRANELITQLNTDQEGLNSRVTSLEDNKYELPPATKTTLGGVKVGANLTIGEDGTLNALGGSEPVPSYELPIASSTTLGGIKIGKNLTIQSDGTLDAPDPIGYTLPTASSEVLGGIKVGKNLTISEDGVLDAADPISPGELPIASATTLGGIKIGANLVIDQDGKVSVNLGDINNQLNSLSTQLTNTSESLSNLSNEVSNLDTQQTSQRSTISDLSQRVSSLESQLNTIQTTLDEKFNTSGGTFTGTVVAGGTQSENTMQVRNIVVYPKGTDISTIDVPTGTVVMIKEE